MAPKKAKAATPAKPKKLNPDAERAERVQRLRDFARQTAIAQFIYILARTAWHLVLPAYFESECRRLPPAACRLPPPACWPASRRLQRSYHASGHTRPTS